MNIKEIAQECGVSTATVSRVINNFPHIHKKTRQNVLAVIQKYNYTPNFFARNLSKKTVETVALIIPENFSTSSYYFMEVLKGISAEIKKTDFSLLLVSAEKDKIPKLFAEKKICGAIFLAPPVNTPVLKTLQKNKKFFVLINAKYKNSPRIDINNVQATQEILTHLYNLGHRKIAIVMGVKNSLNAIERLKTYKKFLLTKNLPLKKHWILQGNFQLETTYAVVKKLFSSKTETPTAIFAENDLMAAGVLKALAEFKIPVPEKVSVAGFDNINISPYLNPPLTTVNQPFEKMGQMAMKIMLSFLNKEKLNREIILPHQIIIRQSTGKANE